MDVSNDFVVMENKCVISTRKIEIKNVSVCELILEKLSQTPNNEVLIDCDVNKAWKAVDIHNAIVKLAIQFMKLGMKKGDIVAACCPNRDFQVFAFFAAIAIGAVYTGCAQTAPINEIRKVISETGASYIISFEKKIEICKQLMSEQNNLKRAFIIDIDENRNDFISIPKLITNSEMEDNSQLKKIMSSITGDDLLQIVYSSGSTGLPKALMISHRNMTADFSTTQPFYNMINGDDTMAHYFPLYHIIGTQIVSFCFYASAKCCLFDDDNDENVYNICRTQNVTSIYLVPSLVNSFNNMFTEQKKLSLKKVISTGDVLPLNVAQEFVSKFKPEYFSQLYGSSEIGTGTVNPYFSGTSDLKSVGFPVFESVIKVVQKDTNIDLPANEIGEIRIKSPLVFKGYFDKNVMNSVFDENGFYKTGDSGYYDENGRFYFVGRLSSIIKYDGWCISPLELESIILEHESVEEAAVVGVNVGILGQIPKAFVVLKEAQKNKITEIELLEYVNSRVVYYKELRGGLVFKQSFPKTSIGKIDRMTLLSEENVAN